MIDKLNCCNLKILPTILFFFIKLQFFHRSVNVQKKIQNSVIPGTVSACANQAGVEKHVPDHVHY